MHKQRTLPLTDQVALGGLWEGFPEPNRDELVQLYAQSMARSVIDNSTRSKQKEPADDKPVG